MKYLLALALALLSTSALAADNYLFTPGSGATMRARDTTGSGGPLAPMTVLSDPSGNPIGGNFSTYGTSPGAVASPYTNAAITNTPAVTQSGGPWSVSGTITANQGTAGSAWPVTISGTPAVTVSSGTVAATQSGTWTGLRIVGNGGGTVDFLSTQNQTTPQQAWLVGGEFNTTPTTITSGNSSPFQLDANGNLLVNVKQGGGTGGTSSSFGSPFPGTGTAVGGSDGSNNFQGLRLTPYGTPPTGLNALATNTFVTNAATPGRTLNGTTGAGASPVVQPSAPNAATGGTAFPIFSIGATTVGVLIKNAAATVFGCQLGNTGSTVAFVKIYNKATAAAVGTDTPVKTLIVPGPGASGGGSNSTFGPGGIALSAGFSIGITANAPNSDTTSVASNNVTVNCDFE